jgi:hypothetical protein
MKMGIGMNGGCVPPFHRAAAGGGAGSQGPNGGSVVGQSGSGDAWTSLSNVLAEDGVMAECSLTSSGASRVLSVTGFGFTVPDGATITGVNVEIVRGRVNNGGACVDRSIKLRSAGATVGDDMADVDNVWPNHPDSKGYGGEADLWGATLTAAVINDSSFGVSVAVGDLDALADIAQVDYVRMTVYYTA